ncbi:MAG: class I SAM-dependent methyltransferase [Methanothermobacter sp.]|nr:class I SAM-dependent methyltransferase [Methanothermobacter sp.]
MIKCMENDYMVKGPIFTGRTFREYIQMFNLNLKKLEGRSILDCAAGASSFTPIMHKLGFDVKAVDISYNKSPEILYQMCAEHLKVLKKALEKKGSYVWKFYKDPDEMFRERLKACKIFKSDYRRGRGERYIMADVRQLPFPSDSFHLVLCSHLLYIYDHRFDWKFHLDSINEMLRVSKGEVRIYPLVKEDGRKSIYLERTLEHLPENVDARLERVDYIFRPSANEMLRLVKSLSAL